MKSPELLLRTERYTEGVVVDVDGTIFFSMTALGTVSRFEPESNVSTIWAHVPDANGHAIAADGTHVVMSSTGAIMRLDAGGRAVHVVASRVGGRWLAYPNDVALDPHRGGYYVTDSGYKATPKTPPADPQGRVYRVDGDGRPTEAAAGIAYSNGIALSPDGRRLYVGESVTRRLYWHPVASDGSLGARVLFAEVPATPDAVPDGITVSSDGRLFVAMHGDRQVLVYAADGTLLETLDAGNKATSHVALSRDGRTLYVSGGIEDEAGAGGIFAIALGADEAKPES